MSMTRLSTERTAVDLIVVHGSEAADVARNCVTLLLRQSDDEGVFAWLTILRAVEVRLSP